MVPIFLKIGSNYGKWVNVQLPSGGTGWISKCLVKKVE
jgi:hypothetical protein